MPDNIRQHLTILYSIWIFLLIFSIIQYPNVWFSIMWFCISIFLFKNFIFYFCTVLTTAMLTLMPIFWFNFDFIFYFIFITTFSISIFFLNNFLLIYFVLCRRLQCRNSCQYFCLKYFIISRSSCQYTYSIHD